MKHFSWPENCPSVSDVILINTTCTEVTEVLQFLWYCSTDTRADAVENGFSLDGGGDYSDVMPRRSPAAVTSCRGMYSVSYCCIFILLQSSFWIGVCKCE